MQNYTREDERCAQHEKRSWNSWLLLSFHRDLGDDITDLGASVTDLGCGPILSCLVAKQRHVIHI